LSSLLFIVNISKGGDSAIVKLVIIHYIYLHTDTQHDISCHEFDSYQEKGSFMTKKLITNAQINLFMKSLSNYKAPPLVKNIDVRAKDYIHYSNGKISIVCMDRFGDIMLDDKFIGVSSLLLSLLKNNCKGFE